MAQEDYQSRLTLWVSALQNLINAYYERNFKLLTPPTIVVNPGKRFDKIVRVDNQRSVHCFIEKATGDIYKAATWSQPAKHVRGNIYREKMLNGVNTYGADYLI